MKRSKYLKRVLALSLTCGMMLTPLAQANVRAEDQLPVTRYATPEQALSSFDTDSGTADKIAKKVIFGKDASGAPLEWYIAGKDPVGGGMVLVSAKPYETTQVFNSTSKYNGQDYEANPSVIYEAGDPEKVYSNHYGVSEIRTVLNGEESLSRHFTSEEKDMLMDNTIKTNDVYNDGVIYQTIDKVYLLSAGDAGYMDYVDKVYIGSATDDSYFGTLVFSLDYWFSNNGTQASFYLRSPREGVGGISTLMARIFKNSSEIYTCQVKDKWNTVAAIQINTDPIDHFEADSSDAAFKIVYKNGSTEDPETESFGELIINDAGNAIDIRGITDEVTLNVVKNGTTYSKTITSDISYPINLLSFDGTFIDSLDGAKVYLEKDGVQEFARSREFYEYDNVLVTDEDGVISKVTDNNHVQNDASQGPASLAFDNNRSTFYHTNWKPEFTVSESNPAIVEIEFSEIVNDIHQMAYLARQDQTTGKGDFYAFEIRYKVNEDDEWTPAKSVSFAQDTPKSEMQFVSFEPFDAKYIQLYITSGFGSHAAASEIDFFRMVDDKFADLDEAIAKAENLIASSSDYTETSISNIKSMLSAANTVRSNPNASVEDIEAATKNLNNAVDFAEPTNLAELKALYDETNAMPNNNYTAQTWQALKTALSNANALLIGSGRTYEGIESAITAIKTAIAGLRYDLDLSELKALVDESSALLEEDHEEEGWAEFAEALEAAEALLASTEQITQDDVDEAQTALQNAKDGLTAKFDKTELRELIDHCRDYMFVDTRYTKESYDKLWDAIDAAELVEADTDTTQKLVDEALENLKAAEEYLLANRIPDNIKIMLREKVAELATFVSSVENEAMYTSSSWSTLETVYADAKEFSDGLELPQNPMRDLYTHYTALVGAYESLEERADLSALNALISECEELDQDQYTADSYSGFSAVLAEAKALAGAPEDVSVTEAQEMLDKLTEAKEGLQYKPADYTKVDEAIEKAGALNKDNYKDFTKVEEAIAQVVRDKNITEQTAVDAMAQAIEDAIAALEYKAADYTKVDEAIAAAEALNKEDYANFAAVDEAIAAVDREKNITEQDEVDAMAQAIEDAIAALEYKAADYTKVDEAIKKAEALNKDDYKDFTKVEEAIGRVVRDKNITEQDEVDAMAQAIEDAIAALEKKEEPDKPGTGDTDEDKPGTGDSDQDKPGTGGTEQKDQPDNNGKSDVPQTGDTANAFIWLIISVALGTGLGAASLYRKKKR